MPISSPFPTLDIPKKNILSYLFPADVKPSDSPIWIDTKNPDVSLSAAQGLRWIKRLAVGLERLGVKRGDVVMIFTPNHIFVPVSYLGVVGAGYAFSGANPAYASSGKETSVVVDVLDY